MKRSDLVLIIAESLVEPHNDDVFKEASHILKRLEDRGMLPPTRKVHSEGGFERENSWEPEDVETSNS